MKEDKSFRLNYSTKYLVSDGQPEDIILTVYACAEPGNNGPPVYNNIRKPISHDLIIGLTYSTGNVIELVELKADLSVVSAEKFPQKCNRSGIPYYVV